MTTAAARRRTALTTACLAAAVIGLAGCGDGNDQAPAPSPTVTVTQSGVAPSSSPTVTSAPATADPVTSQRQQASPATSAPFVDEADVAADARSYLTDGGAGMGYYFRSPTGNVLCGIGFDDPAVRPGCQAISSVPSNTGTVCANGGSSTYATTLLADRPSSHCANQPAYVGSSNNGSPIGGKVLPYGQFIAAGGVTCRSTSYGITCTPDSGAFGFVLARDRNTLFGRGIN
jgi:hypothetical protein